MARSRNAATSFPERSRAVWRAITTTSDLPGIFTRAWRNHSLIQRFTRLRTTALPTRLLTVTPSRCVFSSDIPLSEGVADATMTTKLPDTRRFPDLTTRLKSRVRKIRSARRKRPVFESTDLLRRNAGSEALAALRPTALENRASRARLHSCSKSMPSFPANTAGLIGTFHRRPSILFSFFSEVGEVRGELPVRYPVLPQCLCVQPVPGIHFTGVRSKAFLAKFSGPRA
jgi:hypothetical protein